MTASAPRTTPWPPASLWATAIVLVVATIGGLCLAAGARQVGKPFAGFFVGRNRLVLSIVRSGWSLPHAARVLFAEVVAIEGRPVSDAAEIQRHAAAQPIGAPVRYRFRKNAELFTEVISVQPFTAADLVVLYAGAFGAGLCFAGAGWWIVCRRRDRTPSATAFFVLCQTIAVVLVTGADTHGPDYRLTPLHFAALCATPAAFLYFAGSFPQPIGYGSPWRTATLAALAAAAAAFASTLLLTADTPATFLPLIYSLYLLLANALLLYVARLLTAAWSLPPAPWRRSLRHALAGILLPAVVSEAFFLMSPTVSGSVAPIFLVGPLAVFAILTAAALHHAPALPDTPAASSVNLRLSLLFLGAVETAFLAGIAMLWLSNSRERLLDDFALNQRRQSRVERAAEAGPAATALPAVEALVQTAAERDLLTRAAAALERGDPAGARAALERLGALYRDEEQRLNTQRESLGRVASNLILGLIVIGVAQAAAFMMAVNRWLIRPIDQLAAGTGIIATGDLSHRVQLDSGDEFADLARSINRMATSLGDIQRQVDAEQDARHRAAGAATDEERRRLARELHDGVLQDLGAMKLRLEGEQKRTAAAQLQPVVDGLIAVISELRRLVDDLRPPSLSNISLAEAIAAHAGVLTRGRDLAVDLDLSEELDLAEWATRDVYRIAQEAIRNAVHHGTPKHLSVRLARDANGTLLEVFDDGAGFDRDKAALGGGILGMRERAAALGAELEITTAPGEGTMVRLLVPTAPQRPWRYSRATERSGGG